MEAAAVRPKKHEQEVDYARSGRFAPLLRLHRERCGLSRNRLAHEIGIDPSYLTRIEQEIRNVPRLPVVEALVTRLGIRGPDRDEFFTAAGYAAPSLVKLGWDPAMEAVSEVLRDRRLDSETKAAFRETIIQLARHWQNATH